MARKLPPVAFDRYVSLGSERSYQALAKEYGATKRAVAKKAARENWQERLRKIECSARDEGDKRLAEGMLETRERHVKTVRAIIARALGALKQHPLTTGMEGVRALEIAIKLERLITGEPSGQVEDLEAITKRELQRWLKRGEQENDRPEPVA